MCVCVSGYGQPDREISFFTTSLKDHALTLSTTAKDGSGRLRGTGGEYITSDLQLSIVFIRACRNKLLYISPYIYTLQGVSCRILRAWWGD